MNYQITIIMTFYLFHQAITIVNLRLLWRFGKFLRLFIRIEPKNILCIV